MLSCCLQVTPDHHFVLDRHPHHNNIIIGAGFSGILQEFLCIHLSQYCVLKSLYNIYLNIPALRNHIPKTYGQMATCVSFCQPLS